MYETLQPLRHILKLIISQILNHLRSLGRTVLETLHDKENGIRLCVTCHHALDDAELPGWVFLPADLDFFIDAEHRDFNRRRREFNQSGLFPIRACPKPQHYIQRCGRYDVFMLRRYGPTVLNWRPGRSTLTPFSKSWGGDPMVTLFKAFNALGTHFPLLPAKLMELSRLYDENDATLQSQGNQGNLRPDDQGNADDPSALTPPHRNSAVRGRGRPRGSGGNGNHKAAQGNAAPDQGPSTNTRGHKRQLDASNHTPPPKRLQMMPSPSLYGPHKPIEKVAGQLSGESVRLRASLPSKMRKEVERLMTGLPSPKQSELSFPTNNEELSEQSKVIDWLSGVEAEPSRRERS
ncbi:MAG: hypothetical protein Q9170_007947 [Blastenia crenularia]